MFIVTEYAALNISADDFFGALIVFRNFGTQSCPHLGIPVHDTIHRLHNFYRNKTTTAKGRFFTSDLVNYVFVYHTVFSYS